MSPLKRIGSVVRPILERVLATEYQTVRRSRRFRAAQRRRTRAAVRVAMFVVIGAYTFDIVASGEHGLIVVAIDAGLIGLALMGLWSLVCRARHHPELVAWIVTSGVVFTMAATAVAVPDLMLQTVGYLLILPGLVALMIPWRTRTHLAWLVAYLVVAGGYFALDLDDGLSPHLRGDLFTVVIVACGASLAGHEFLQRAQMRSFARMEHIRALRRQGDAYVAQLTRTHGAMRTLETTARQFEQQALHDPLTGLPNRALFWELVSHRLAIAGRRRAGFAVLFIDIDDFKAVNDALGHAAGDRVIVDVASRLRAALRAGDTAARLGGDEFAVLLDDVATDEAAAVVAERVTEALRAPYEFEDQRFIATASVGVAVGPAGFRAADDVVAAADDAMYDAKKRGGGRYVLHGA